MPEQNDITDLHPPLHLRCVVFHGEIDRTLLEKNSSLWLKHLSTTFPVAKQRTEWTLEMVGKDENLKPKIKLDLFPVQERHDEIGRVTADITSYPDKVMLRLQRQGKYLGAFTELIDLTKEFVPTWLDIFQVKRITGLEVIYVNLLCKEYTPNLVVDVNGVPQLEVGRALEMFRVIPGKHPNLRSPYLAEMNAHVKDDTIFSFHVNDLPSGNLIGGPAGWGIQVNFAYRTGSPGKPLEYEKAIEEMTAGHNLLLEQFKHYFTAEARNSFK